MLGIDRLNKKIHELTEAVEQQNLLLKRLQQFLETGIGISRGLSLKESAAALGLRLERMESSMPTRAEFDAAKQALGQAISDAAARVSADIQALRNQIAAGNPVTDQDLAELQADITNVGNIDPSVVPPPTP